MRIQYNFIFKIVITFILSVILVIALDKFEERIETDLIKTSNVEQMKENLEDILITCYAVEGAYPSDVKYVEKYGFVFDYDKYIYEYEVSTSYQLPKVNVKLR